MSQNLIMREIGIDMGHRVANHGGKCRNLHGHRYRIQAFLSGDTIGGTTRGEQDGMLMDFGFLKNLMMEKIDTPCDHGTCLWVLDPNLSLDLGERFLQVREDVLKHGHSATVWSWGKLYLLRVTPTAENLAQHWFTRLDQAVDNMVGHHGVGLHSVRVWETPNCYAEYIGE